MGGRPICGIVGATLPIELGRTVVEPLPPRLTVISQRDIGVDGVALDHRQRVRVRLRRFARCHAEIARLGIDDPQLTVGAGAHSADVVADRPDLPSGLMVSGRRHQHGEVGLATGAREGSGDVKGVGPADFRCRRSACARPTTLPRAPAMTQYAMRGTSCQARLSRHSRTRRTGTRVPRGMHDETTIGI